MSETGSQPEQPVMSHKEWVHNQYLGKLQALGGDSEKIEKLARELTEERLRLEEMAMKDPLTGAFNRRYVSETLEWEMRAAPYLGNTVGLLFVDIDKFKSINDEEPEGHKAGDRALVELVKEMKGAVGDVGYVARYGGEEFLIVFLNTDQEKLLNSAKALSVNISTKLAKNANLTRDQVTASMGLVVAGAGESASEFLLRGDKLMYQAKQEGRSRICYTGADGQTEAVVIQ